MRESNRQAFNTHCGRPQRVCWAVAAYEGQRTICPIGWKMWTSMQPPMMAISVAPSRYAHELIVASGSFVLAWPGAEQAEATLTCGTRSGREFDKFDACGLTPMPGRHGDVPLVRECVANLECRLAGQLTTGDHTIFAGEILAYWVREDGGKALCQVGHEEGYDFLAEQGMYRFGVVKG